MQKTDNWQRIWNDDGSSTRCTPAKTILYAFSLLYRLIISLRNRLYDHKIFSEKKLACPVISVGNITVGGTGKTPCVIWLTRMLQEEGFRPAVLSRGYGGKSAAPVNIVSDGENILLSAAEAGDEPYLIARSLPGIPVITGPQRILTGNKAIENFGSDILICDDAFQHRRIFRDINLALLDSEKPWGNGYLLPRGELREPVTALRRADAFLLTRADEVKKISAIPGKLAQAENIPVFLSTHKIVDIVCGNGGKHLSLAELKDKKVCAFAGIARPDSFQSAIKQAGAKLVSFDIFSDHHRYSPEELKKIRNNFLRNNADLLITTEKDGMRLTEFPEFLAGIYLLRVKLAIIPDENALKNFILGKLENRLKTKN